MGIYSKTVGGKMETGWLVRLCGVSCWRFVGLGSFGLVVLKTVGLFSLSSLKII